VDFGVVAHQLTAGLGVVVEIGRHRESGRIVLILGSAVVRPVRIVRGKHQHPGLDGGWIMDSPANGTSVPMTKLMSGS
jgi:hypothetical protein